MALDLPLELARMYSSLSPEDNRSTPLEFPKPERSSYERSWPSWREEDIFVFVLLLVPNALLDDGYGDFPSPFESPEDPNQRVWRKRGFIPGRDTMTEATKDSRVAHSREMLRLCIDWKEK